MNSRGKKEKSTSLIIGSGSDKSKDNQGSKAGKGNKQYYNPTDKTKFSKGLELAMFLKVWKILQFFASTKKSSDKTNIAKNKTNDKLKNNDKRKEIHFQKRNMEEKEKAKAKNIYIQCNNKRD